MSQYSDQARRFAALTHRQSRTSPTEVEPVAPPAEESTPDLPAHAPLDRRHRVEIKTMNGDELRRAIEQARSRVERTKPGSKLDRYKKQLQALENVETVLTESGQHDEPEVPPPPPVQGLKRIPTPTVPPDAEPSLDQMDGPRFHPHPNDTPESSRI